MKLVIVESPSKAKTIEKYLGKEYKVIASKGHIIDLPKSELGFDENNNFEPKYIVTKEKSLADIKKLFNSADELILAVDPDREGEAIGWHIANRLGTLKKNNAKPLSRIVFTEITKEAIQNAIKNPRNIDIDLVNAQQARRILDRMVGYKLSPLIWKKVRYGLSAGRVQSVALKLIVDREEERNAFDPKEYWSMQSLMDTSVINESPKVITNFSGEELDKSIYDNLLKFDLVKYEQKSLEINTKAKVDEILQSIQNKKWYVKGLESKTVKRSPQPPFNTSSLQQTASSKLGFSASRTMKAAQKLYESGLITYMRTDSIKMSDQSIDKLRKYIINNFDKKDLSISIRSFKSKAKVAQEAHEAIRPTEFSLISINNNKVNDDEKKLYKLIWERSVASQMSDAELISSSIKVEVNKYIFTMNGQRISYKGYLKVYSQTFVENELPVLEVGQQLYPIYLLNQQHFTQPPARYSEATLIKSLESYGIGRPSTYAPIISTIQARGYVEKIGKYLIPTDTGVVVNSLLSKHFSDIVDTKFTADIENDLDKIANKELDWVKMLKKFQLPFYKQLEKKNNEIKKEDFTILGKSEELCPECKGAMIIKLGRFGRFLSCNNFPTCKGMLSLNKEGEKENIDINSEEFISKYQSPPKTDDGREYLLKNSRFGYFWAHPDYPKVKDAKPLEYQKSIKLKLYGKTPLSKDNKKMVLKKGRFGEFWAHPNYPEIKEIIRINQKQLKDIKQELEVW
jgi:DNA topoisomerase I